jgi:hypothetical protein
VKKNVKLKTAGTILTVIGGLVSLISNMVDEARQKEEMREIANEVYDERTEESEES